MVIPWTVELILLYKISYFREPYGHSKTKIKNELNLSNYATKSDLKSATHIHTSIFVEKAYLASLKLDFDKLDIDKLETTPIDLSKLSNVLTNNVVKKTVYDELVKKT